MEDKVFITEQYKEKERDKGMSTMKLESEALKDGKQKGTQTISHLCATCFIVQRKNLWQIIPHLFSLYT